MSTRLYAGRDETHRTSSTTRGDPSRWQLPTGWRWSTMSATVTATSSWLQSSARESTSRSFGFTGSGLVAVPSGRELLERQLLRWNAVHENVRPHQALGYRTPNEFHAKWVAERATRKEAAAPDMHRPSALSRHAPPIMDNAI